MKNAASGDTFYSRYQVKDGGNVSNAFGTTSKITNDSGFFGKRK